MRSVLCCVRSLQTENGEAIMRKPILGVLMLVLISANAAAAEDEYDPLDQRAILSYAEKSAIDQGSSALTDVGMNLLGAAADAWVPGIGSLLGLSSEDDGTKRVLDAIEADGTTTRNMILDFWDWARQQQGAEISANYATVEYLINSWNSLPRTSRLPNRSNLDIILSDCVNVMARFQTGPRPLDRVDHLHAYLTLLNLTIALEAERSELQILGAEWEFAGGGDPGDWWESLGADEQDWINDAIKETKQERVEALLLPGLQVSFADQMAGMDRGTLPGGTPTRTDYEVAVQYQFSSLVPGYPPDGFVGDGQARWFYFLGHNDPQPFCQNKTRYCTAYTIQRGSFNSGAGMFKYLVDFEGAYDPAYYESDSAPYWHHMELLYGDMVMRGYGAARVFAETWWDAWELGDRQRLLGYFGTFGSYGLDEYVDDYLDSRDDVHEGALNMLVNFQTRNITTSQKSRIYGFALGQGLDAVVQISSAAAATRDWLDRDTVTKWPYSAHRNAIRAYPAPFEDLKSFYRGIPVAKLVAAKII
jgi:hypothetical protein